MEDDPGLAEVLRIALACAIMAVYLPLAWLARRLGWRRK